MQEKHFLTNVWHIVQDVCPPGNQKCLLSDWFKRLSSHFFLFGELSDSNYKNEQTKRDKLALGANAILVIVFVYFNGS